MTVTATPVSTAVNNGHACVEKVEHSGASSLQLALADRMTYIDTSYQYDLYVLTIYRETAIYMQGARYRKEHYLRNLSRLYLLI